jgi:hypothetical protein
VRLRGLVTGFLFDVTNLSNFEGSCAVDKFDCRFLDPRGHPFVCTMRGPHKFEVAAKIGVAAQIVGVDTQRHRTTRRTAQQVQPNLTPSDSEDGYSSLSNSCDSNTNSDVIVVAPRGEYPGSGPVPRGRHY